VGRRKFTDWARRQARLLARVLIKSSLFAYGFLKVALPSHSDRIANFTEGPSRRSGHSLVRSRTAGIDPKRLFNAERIKAVFPNRGASFGPTVTAAVVEFGLPGATAHMVDEHVAIADIEALTEIYAAVLEDYFRKE
jgi:hypothetical protein